MLSGNLLYLHEVIFSGPHAFPVYEYPCNRKGVSKQLCL